MPTIIRNKKSIGEQAKERNLYADVELQKDKDTISRAIDNEIKNKGYSPSYELAEHRKMIKLILDKLGITDEEFKAYYKEVEEIKTNVREQNKMHE